MPRLMDEYSKYERCLKKCELIRGLKCMESLIRELHVASCKVACFSRSSFHRLMGSDTVFQEAVEELKEATGDFVESKLLKRINNDDTTGIIFYCKTKLKSRGYIERNETEHSGDPNKPLVTKIIREVVDPNDGTKD